MQIYMWKLLKDIFQRSIKCWEMIGDSNRIMILNRIAKTFLNDNVPEVMDWPSNSPDLNPIENLWNIVKTNVEKRMPDNRGDLEQFMKEEWGEIPDSVLINLVNSMKTRCELVIEKNGERIPY